MAAKFASATAAVAVHLICYSSATLARKQHSLSFSVTPSSLCNSALTLRPHVRTTCLGEPGHPLCSVCIQLISIIHSGDSHGNPKPPPLATCFHRYINESHHFDGVGTRLMPACHLQLDTMYTSTIRFAFVKMSYLSERPIAHTHVRLIL